MPEPTTSSASAFATLATVYLASTMASVNADALIGAFAGAAVFAIHSTDISVPKRFAYMLVSILIGYMGAEEVITHTWLQSYVMASFGLSSLVVALTLASIDRMRDFDFTKMFRRDSR